MKLRLAIMNFLEFAVWGAYLTCMGNYLGTAGLGDKISWFYAIQGIVSIFMPTLMGIVADKYIQPQRLLGLCHLLAGGFMLGCWWLGTEAGFGQQLPDQSLFIALYSLSVAFYMPTIALANTTAFTILKNNALDTVNDFPPIRVLGTVGFIATMWFVNCAYFDETGFGFTLADNAHKFQYTYMQFFVSGLLSMVLCAYCFTLPECKLEKKDEKVSLVESLGLNAFKLFKTKRMALFFIFSALLGMCLQVTNGFAGPFLTSFNASPDPVIADSFAADNATLLTSISQISEAFCILLIPFFLRRFGIKVVMLMSMFAWVFRFGFFGIGEPTMPGVIFFILSCIVYGVAFDFFNVSGGIFVDQECEPRIKASAQGLFMMMTNGIGATIGTLAAGEVVNSFCQWENGYLVGEWSTCWFVFAGFALVVGVLFALLFNPQKTAAAVALCLLLAVPAQAAKKKTAAQPTDREYWCQQAWKMAQPVLENMARGELQKNMQTEFSPSFDNRNRKVVYMETFGRLMAGVAPWLALPDTLPLNATDADKKEVEQRRQLREWALASYKNSVDPQSPDYLVWGASGQNLVDAAYIAESFIRAYDALWLPLDQVTKQRYITEFKKLRAIEPPYTNWFLFSSTIESFLAKAVGLKEYDDYRVMTTIRKVEEWYVGDGWYADGPVFAFDYYSSYVFHAMYLETLQNMIDARANTRLEYRKYYDRALKRAQKFSIILERFISPEGTFPVIGRSTPYRMAALQPLALMAWYQKLPKELSNGQVRAALTKVMHRMYDEQNNYNEGGFLTIGFCGHQPETADWYTNNGSLYMTSLSLMPLGLPADHPFWTSAAEPWTQVKAWGGQPFPKDHRWADDIVTKDRW